MGRLSVIAGLLLAASAGSAAASSLDIEQLRHAVRSVTQSLLGQDRPDRDVIAAPQDLDRQMALVPPASGPRMPVIEPPR